MNSHFPGVAATTPVYQLLVDHFLDDDTLHLAGETIAYEGPPSEHMAPLNEAATSRVEAMNQQLEDAAREKADMVGRKYTGRLTDLGDIIAQASADAKTLQQREAEASVRRSIPQPLGDKPVPQMPTMKPLAIRKQDTEAKTSVRAFGTQVAKGRATEVIHKPGQDRLTEKAPIEG